MLDVGQGTRGELRELERLGSAREFDAVISHGTALLKKRWLTGDEALIRFHLGQAYCRQVKPDEALEHLRVAHEYFELAGDELMLVETLDWESAAMGLKEDPAAIPLGMSALQRCRELKPRQMQIEARILGHVAAMHVTARSLTEAVSFYEAAADAAGSVKDLLQEAKMHHGLAVAHQSQRQFGGAMRHFEKALALYSMQSDSASVQRVENDLGYLLLEQGNLDQAEDHLLKALAGCDALHLDRRGRGFVLNSLGELNLKRGDLKLATVCLRWALAAGEATGERIVQAGAHVLLGGCEEHQGNYAAADTHMETALRILEQLDVPERVRETRLQHAKMRAARRVPPDPAPAITPQRSGPPRSRRRQRRSPASRSGARG